MARVTSLSPSKNTPTSLSTSRGKLEIVAATAHDRFAITDLLKQVWLDTYVDPANGVTRRDITEHAKAWDTPEGLPIPGYLQNRHTRRWVAKYKGKVVGYCRVCQLPGSGRLQVLHVLPANQGMGIGRRLLARALDWLDSSQPVYLKVVSYNARAIDYYQKHGFRKTRKFAVHLRSGKLLPKYEMVKEPRLDVQTSSQDR